MNTRSMTALKEMPSVKTCLYRKFKMFRITFTKKKGECVLSGENLNM